MIPCQLLKNESSNIGITPTENDFVTDYSIRVEVDAETLEEMLDIQNKYRILQRKLRELYKTHENAIY